MPVALSIYPVPSPPSPSSDGDYIDSFNQYTHRKLEGRQRCHRESHGNRNDKYHFFVDLACTYLYLYQLGRDRSTDGTLIRLTGAVVPCCLGIFISPRAFASVATSLIQRHPLIQQKLST